MFSAFSSFSHLRGREERESNQEKQTRLRRGNERWGVDGRPGSPALGHQRELQPPLQQPGRGGCLGSPIYLVLAPT